jgi:hypothetical protein
LVITGRAGSIGGEGAASGSSGITSPSRNSGNQSEIDGFGGSSGVIDHDFASGNGVVQVLAQQGRQQRPRRLPNSRQADAGSIKSKQTVIQTTATRAILRSRFMRVTPQKDKNEPGKTTFFLARCSPARGRSQAEFRCR